MQEPIDNLTEPAQHVWDLIREHPDGLKLEDISERTGMRPGVVANALRELEAGQRAVESMGPLWSPLL